MAKKRKQLLYSTGILLLIALCVLGILFLPSRIRYRSVKKQIEQGNYMQAYQTLLKLGDYRNSPELLKNFRFNYTRSNTEQIRCDENGNEIGTIWTEAIYDQQGNNISSISYDTSGNIVYFRSTEYTYDDNGYPVMSVIRDFEEQILSSNAFTYDKDGNLTVKLCTDKDGNITEKIEHAYDYSGCLVLTVVYGADGQIKTQTEYLHNQVGNTIKETHYNKNGLIYTVEYIYNENLLLQKRKYNEASILTEQTDYTYNQENMVTLICVTDVAGKICQKVQYEYNDLGLQVKSLVENFYGYGGEIQKTTIMYMDYTVQYNDK